MCQQQIEIVANVDQKSINDKNIKMKTSYTIKKILRAFFKKQQKQTQRQQQKQQQQQQQQEQNICASLESFESLDNMRNSEMEELFYEEIVENSANEKLANMENEAEAEDIFVPVRFARTDAGTFFWTTNLQPVFNTLAADEDLLQPAYCYSNYQFPSLQYKPVQDRWAQA